MPPKPKKDSRAYLMDILDSARLAVEYLGDTSPNAYHDDTKLQDAIVRRFEIMGEAAKRIDESVKESFTDVQWTEIAGMRDILIHRYDGIDHTLVYETVQAKLPELILTLEKYFDTNPE